MKKHLGVTRITTPRSNHCNGAIYEHCGKFYILATKCESYSPFVFKGRKYTEVVLVGGVNGMWFVD
jgi:hypothetical protein